MNKTDFLIELEDILEREEECNAADKLDEYEEWDSLSKMAVMAFFDKQFNIKIEFGELQDIKTVEDLIALSNGNIA